MSTFILGLAVFFGIHSTSLQALDWRNRAAAAIGLSAWRIGYSLISLAGFYLLVAGYTSARATTGFVYVTPPAFRYLTAILMLPVMTLVLASVLRGRIAARARHPLLLAAILAGAPPRSTRSRRCATSREVSSGPSPRPSG